NGELKFEDKEFPEKLKVIIHNVLKKEDFEGNKVDSRELNKNPQILEYLKNVKSENAEKVKKEIQENKHTDIFGNETTKLGKNASKPKPTVQPQQRKTPKTKENETLFGKTLALKSGKV